MVGIDNLVELSVDLADCNHTDLTTVAAAVLERNRPTLKHTSGEAESKASLGKVPVALGGIKLDIHLPLLRFADTHRKAQYA